jgi:hypothetical protein
VPKRSEERRRRNKSGETERVAMDGDVLVPAPHENWHPIAHDWYCSLAASGQSQFFEPSDWEAARYVAEVMTKNLEGKFSAVAFAAVWSAMTDLLTTEGARRRVRLEVERGGGEVEEPAGVTAIAQYRRRVAGH